MDKKSLHYIIVMSVAILTYLMRFLPMKFKDRLNVRKFQAFLSSSSIAIISALFITSFMSSTKNLSDLPMAVFTLSSVFVFYKLWKNLGLSILMGVLVHFFLSLIFSGV